MLCNSIYKAGGLVGRTIRERRPEIASPTVDTSIRTLSSGNEIGQNTMAINQAAPLEQFPPNTDVGPDPDKKLGS